MKEAGFGRDEWSIYNELRDYVANLELLLSHENQEKSKMPFEQWIKTRDTSFKKRHLIPDDADLWKFKNFERFVEERERLVEKRLVQLFGLPESGEKEA